MADFWQAPTTFQVTLLPGTKPTVEKSTLEESRVPRLIVF